MKYLRNSLHLLVIATLTLRVAARWPPSYMARQQVNAEGATAPAGFPTLPSGVDQMAQNGSSTLINTVRENMPSPRPVSTFAPLQNANPQYPCPGLFRPMVGPGCCHFDQPCCTSFCPCPCTCPCPGILPALETCSCFNTDMTDPCKCDTPFPPCFGCEGGSANQPNIITQSVSLCPTKRPMSSAAYNESSMNYETFTNSINDGTDAYYDNADSYAPRPRILPIRIRDGKRKAFRPVPDEDDAEYINDEEKYENSLEMRVNRIVEMLDRLQAKQDVDGSSRPFSSRLRQKKFQDPEEEEEEEQETYVEKLEPRKLSPLRRMNQYRKYEDDPEAEYVQARKGPKLDWLMLKSKKSPKQYSFSEDEPEKKCLRRMKYALAADDDEEEDIRDDRDILFVPERTKSYRQRRYD